MFVSSSAIADSTANRLTKEMGLQGRVMWFDAEANLFELSSREKVAETVAKCRDANINTIVVDVKPLAGLVLYNSSIAPKLTSFKGKDYPADFDLLRTVIEEGHRAGISVHAAINTFAEGSKDLPGGPACSHKDWQCVQYETANSLTTEDGINLDLQAVNAPLVKNAICLYGKNILSAGKLPQGTTYLTVNRDGLPLQCSTICGSPSLLAPDGGYILLATGDAACMLQSISQSGTRLRFESKDAMVRSGDLGDMHKAIFVNPLKPEVRAYALSIIKEICTNYDIDGIVLDRMRYPGVYADFSDETKRKFEEFLGRPVSNWPRDVYKRDPLAGPDIIRGPLFKDWLKFRAKVIRDFLAEARDVVKSTKEKVQLGMYVGSWYPLYYDVGVNWGSQRNVASNLDWWPDGYEQTGYADLLDYMCTGCYYEPVTRKQAEAEGFPDWQSVEAAADESINAVKDDTFVYGSLYVLQYDKEPDRFVEAIKKCLEKTQGCMIFDLVYIRNYNWWNLLKQAFASPTTAPNDVKGLLSRVRSERKGQEEANTLIIGL